MQVTHTFIGKVTLIWGFFFLFSDSMSQVPKWIRTMGGNNNEDGVAITVDSEGNTYEVGTLRSNYTIFGMNIPINNPEVFVAKYNSDGVPIWLETYGGIGSQWARGISIFEDEVYITGGFKDFISFEFFNTRYGSNEEIFLAKFDTSGNFIWGRRAGGGGSPPKNQAHEWVRRSGGNENDKAEDVAILNNKVYTTGFVTTKADFNTPPNENTNYYTTIGNEDVFLTKHDSAGNLLHFQGFGSADYDRGVNLIAQDSLVYLIGDYQSSVNMFDLGKTIDSEGSDDIFVLQILDTTFDAALPPIVITGPDSVCLGQASTYTALPDLPSMRWIASSQNGTTPGNTITLANDQPGQDTLILYYQSNIVDTVVITVFDEVKPRITGDPQPCIGKLTPYAVDNPTPGSLYTWSIQGGNIISVPGSPSAQVQWDTASTTRLIVMETTPTGCIGADTLDVQVRYVPFGNSLLCPDDPLPSIQIQGPNAICQGKTLTLSAQPDTLDLAWKWESGDSSALGQTVDLAWPRIGQDSVFLFFQGTAVDTALITIQISPDPKIQGDTLPCFGKEVNYTLQTLSPGSNYFWEVQGGSILSSQMSDHLMVRWDSVQATQLLLRETNSSGCQNTDYLDVQVRNIPFGNTYRCPDDTQPLYQIVGPNTICQGNSAQYGLSPDTTGVVWRSSTGQVLSIDVPLAYLGNRVGTDSLFLEIGGIVMDTLAIQVLGDQNPQINGPQISCENEISTYTVQSQDRSAPIQWFIAGGEILTDSQASQVEVRWQVGDNQYLGVVLGNECPSQDSVRIQVDALPSFQIQGDTAVCNNLESTYTITEPGNSIVWEIKEGTILSGQSTHQITVSWLLEGQGNVRVSQNTPGTSCRAQVSLPIQPNQDFISTLNVSSSGKGSEDCLRSPIRLFAEAQGPVLQYDWYHIDQKERIGTGPSLNIQEPGLYQVIALGACNQVMSDTLLVQSPQVLVPNLFTPNQDNQDDLFLLHTYDTTSLEKIELRIFDRRGNVVFYTENISEAFEQGWDGDQAGNGSYVWTLKVSDKFCGIYQQRGVINLIR